MFLLMRNDNLNAEEKNWLKASQATYIVIWGIQPFVAKELNDFKRNIFQKVREKANIPTTTVCTGCNTANLLQCPTPGICTKRGISEECKSMHYSPIKQPRPCTLGICGAVCDEITRSHRFGRPNWEETSAEKWESGDIDFAKCFMPSTQPEMFTPSKPQFADNFKRLIEVMLNCKHFDDKFSFPVEYNRYTGCEPCLLTKALDLSRRILHSWDCTVSSTDVQEYFTTLNELLSDSKCLSNNIYALEARKMLNKLQEGTLEMDTQQIVQLLETTRDALSQASEDTDTLYASIKSLDVNRETETPEDLIRKKKDLERITERMFKWAFEGLEQANRFVITDCIQQNSDKECKESNPCTKSITIGTWNVDKDNVQINDRGTMNNRSFSWRFPLMKSKDHGERKDMIWGETPPIDEIKRRNLLISKNVNVKLSIIDEECLEREKRKKRARTNFLITNGKWDVDENNVQVNNQDNMTNWSFSRRLPLMKCKDHGERKDIIWDETHPQKLPTYEDLEWLNGWIVVAANGGQAIRFLGKSVFIENAILVPNIFNGLQKLKELVLFDCKCNGLDLSSCPNLENIDISGQVTLIPNALRDLVRLRQLTLECKCDGLDLSSCKNLEEIDISGHVTLLPNSLRDLTQVKSLAFDCSNN